MEGDDEDDYMAMTFATEPVETETSLQRRARREREGELKGRIKSKAELDAEAVQRREAALATSIDESNVGFRMMKRLGYQPGSTLGKATDARTQPIEITTKEDRSGIGLDSLKKRKFREQWEQEAKRVKHDEREFRERLHQEREEKRKLRIVHSAQKICEQLESESEAKAVADDEEFDAGSSAAEPHTCQSSEHTRPLKSINVIWRGLVRQRLEVSLKKRADYDMQVKAKSLPSFEVEDDEHDQSSLLAFQTPDRLVEDRLAEEELEESDNELNEFSELSASDQLAKIVQYLRTKHKYCLWCKQGYPTDELDGCPGPNEDDHA